MSLNRSTQKYRQSIGLWEAIVWYLNNGGYTHDRLAIEPDIHVLFAGLNPENVSGGGHTPTFQDLWGGGGSYLTAAHGNLALGGTRFIHPCAAKRGKKV